MKKVIFVGVVILSIIFLLAAMTILNNSAFIVYIVLISILLSAYAYLEISAMGPKEIALIGTLSAFAAVMRVPFAALPNIQPTTFLVAISGYVFGPYKGFLIGINTAFVSNIFLGQGPWTPWQMAAWGIIGFFTGIIGRSHYKKEKTIKVEYFAMLCFLYGFLFDWIMNLWHVLGFIKPLNLYTIAVAYFSGLVFDIMHAAGNFIFAMFFFERIYKVLLRFRRRFEIYYKDEV